MATYTVQPLSGSVSGRPIAVGTGTAIHTAHATSTDELWLYVSNPTSGAIDLTVAVAATSVVALSIPAKTAEMPLFAGSLRLTGAVAVTATASAGLYIYGTVNRIVN